MSRRLPSPRNAIAGVGLAAAGMVYRRLSGRKQADEEATAPIAPEAVPVDDAAVARARSELADELARRATRSDA
jgi:hypothetical protein